MQKCVHQITADNNEPLHFSEQARAQQGVVFLAHGLRQLQSAVFVQISYSLRLLANCLSNSQVGDVQTFSRLIQKF